MEKIEKFWNWFEENNEDYNNFNEKYEKNPKEAKTLLDELTKELHNYSKGLFVELSTDEMIITAQGNREYFADAFELVNHAPTIENWNFIATKPAIGLDFNFKMGDITINPSEITFMPLEADEYPDDVAIRLFHKDYTNEEGAKRNAVIVGLYSALNMFLGEIATTVDFQYIDFDDIPHPKEETFPFAGLKDYVEYKKGKRANSKELFPTENISLMEGKIEKLPNLLVINRALKFYEFTEKYPYLLQMTLSFKNIGENGLPTGNTDEIYLIEDIIYQEIYKNKKGHFMATETYNGKRDIFYYADSKETIVNTLNTLLNKYESCKVDYSIDFDPFWIRVDRYREL